MLALKLALLVLETIGPGLLTSLDAYFGVDKLGIAVMATALPQTLVPTPACPVPPGTFIQVEGANYEVLCNTALGGDNIGGFTIQDNYAACVARCSDTPGCVGATYSAIDKHCEVHRALTGSSTVPGSTSFRRVNLANTTRSVTQGDRSADCNFDEYYITVNGKNYGIRCNQAGTNPNVLSRTTEQDYAMCLAICAYQDGCQAAQYAEVDQQCTLYKNVGGFKMESGTSLFLHFVNKPGIFDPTIGGLES